tara:strand:+ start:2407 stop:2784 length:378 start_codon:yes stop_codon:yes gene_type:complete
MTTGNITITNGSTGYTVTGSLPSNAVWTTSAGPYYMNSSINATSTGDVVISTGKLKVNGDDADIQIGEVSLKKFMEDVSMRLNIMQPNTKLEKDWEELRELGDQYRQLEKEMIEKARVWNILKTP